MAKTSQKRFLPRDLEGLAVIARFRMLKRAQLHRWKFPGLSDTVVRRFINRMVERGLLGSERLNKNGTQVIWCTMKGRDLLVAEGVARADDLFPARGPVAMKDLAHTGAIINCAIRLSELGRAGDAMLPAWALQRRLGGRIEVIPDLLCLTSASDAQRGSVLALEVDLANEPIANYLTAKTSKLASFLHSYSSSTVAILLLTVGDGRLRAIRDVLRAAGIAVPIAVEDLVTFTAESVRTECSVEGTLE